MTISIGSGSPSAPGPFAYPLTRSSGGTWTGSAHAPAVPGQYHFTVLIVTGAGKHLVQDNDGWNINVTGASQQVTPTRAAVASVPPELLAPPFSYGAPQPSVFNAAGQSVSGEEVVSNARTDVAPATVLAYYNAHLPRAGWSITSPPAGNAPSFTLSATQGQQVAIIQYAAAVVRIFVGRT